MLKKKLHAVHATCPPCSHPRLASGCLPPLSSSLPAQGGRGRHGQAHEWHAGHMGINMTQMLPVPASIQHEACRTNTQQPLFIKQQRSHSAIICSLAAPCPHHTSAEQSGMDHPACLAFTLCLAFSPSKGTLEATLRTLARIISKKNLTRHAPAAPCPHVCAPSPSPLPAHAPHALSSPAAGSRQHSGQWVRMMGALQGNELREPC